MLRERLAGPEFTATTPRPIEFLEAAATIGLAFTEAALRCITRDDGTACDRLLPVLTASGILQRDGTVIRFAHEILQEAASAEEAAKRRELYARHAECLRLLSPADYDARALFLDRAGRIGEARTMAVMAALAKLRNGVLGGRPMRVVGDAPAIEEAAALLDDATRRWLANEYPRVVELLERFPQESSELLAAECAYLVADSLLKSIEAGDRRAVTDMLDGWRTKVRDEFELWFRLGTTLMISHSHAGDLVAARAVEREIAAEIDRRRRFDPEAVVHAYTLYRKSDALHEPEIVARRQQEAFRFFRGDPSAGAPRHPAEYARTAANLIGTLVVLGDFAMAESVAAELLEWTNGAPAASLPRATVALNNLFLAKLLASTSSPTEVTSAFDELSAVATRAEDRFLIASNLASVKVRAGDLNGALHVLESCDRDLQRLYQPDPYYVYFVRSNLVACQFHAGVSPDPIAAWVELERPLASVHEPLRPFLSRRHELLAVAFAEVSRGDLDGWDNYLRDRHPRQLGRPWAFYGRGFLLTDIQHWSDG